MGFLYDLPFAKARSNAGGDDRSATGSSTASTRSTPARRSRSAATTPRSTSAAAAQTIDLVAPLQRVGEPGPNAVYYNPASFAQPGNKWGNTGRNQFRGPSVYNLDMGLFRGFPVGRYRLEFRATASNVLNHARWGNPVTGFTNPNFMRIRYGRRNPAQDSARTSLRVLIRLS